MGYGSLKLLTKGHSYVWGTYSGLGVTNDSFRRELNYRCRSLYAMSWTFVGQQTGGGSDFPGNAWDGVNGDSSTGMLSTLPAALSAGFPTPTSDCCALLGPIEFADALAAVPLATFYSNIMGMITACCNYSPLIKIFLVTGPAVPNYIPATDINPYASQVRAAYAAALASGKNVFLIDVNSQSIHIPKPSDSGGGDNLHPDWLGYEQMGDYITDQMCSQLGIISGTPYVLLQDLFTGADNTNLSAHAIDVNNTGAGWVDPNNRFKIISNTAKGVGGAAFDTYLDLNQVVWTGSISIYASVNGTIFALLKAKSDMSAYLYFWLNTGTQKIQIGNEGGPYSWDNAPFACADGSWYTFSIVISGNSISIYYGSALVIKTPLLGYGPYTRIGLSYSPGGVSEFDNLLVYGNNTLLSAPVVTPGTWTGQIGSAFSYSIAATNSPTSYGAIGLPTGLSINTATGLITGTNSNVIGTYLVTVSATNAAGTGTAALVITISGIGRPASSYQGVLNSLLPLGRAWSRTGGAMPQLTLGMAQALSRVDSQMQIVLTEKDTRYTSQLISEWETELGITPLPTLTLAQRVSAVHAQYVATGGQTKAYFIGLALAMGYVITITEFTPFWCGLGTCGQPCGSQQNLFYWMVNLAYIQGGTDPTGLLLQTLLAPLVPAHTVMLWNIINVGFSNGFSNGFQAMPVINLLLGGGFSRHGFSNGFAVFYGGGFSKLAWNSGFASIDEYKAYDKTNPGAFNVGYSSGFNRMIN